MRRGQEEEASILLRLVVSPGDEQRAIEAIRRIQAAAGDVNIRVSASAGQMRVSGSADAAASALGVVARTAQPRSPSTVSPPLPPPERVMLPWTALGGTQWNAQVSARQAQNRQTSLVMPLSGDRSRVIPAQQALAAQQELIAALGAGGYARVENAYWEAIANAPSGLTSQQLDALGRRRAAERYEFERRQLANPEYARADAAQIRTGVRQEARDEEARRRAEERERREQQKAAERQEREERRLAERALRDQERREQLEARQREREERERRRAEERAEAAAERARAAAERRQAAIVSGDQAMLDMLGVRASSVQQLLSGDTDDAPGRRGRRYRQALARLGARARGVDPADITDDNMDDFAQAGAAVIGPRAARRGQIAASFMDIASTPLGTYFGKLARGAVIAVGRSGAEYFQALQAEEATGIYDIQGRMRAGYSVVGGLIGAGIGSFFPGFFGPYLGAGVGAEVGRAFADWMIAPLMRAQYATAATAPYSIMFGNIQTPGAIYNTGDEAKKQLNAFRKNVPGTVAKELEQEDRIQTSDPGYIGDPPSKKRWTEMTAGIEDKMWLSVQSQLKHLRRAAFGTRDDSSLFMTDTDKWFRLYLQQTPDVVKQISPIYMNYNALGGNMADIFSEFGLETAATYNAVLSAVGEGTNVTQNQIYRAHRTIQAAARQARLGGISYRFGSLAYGIGRLQGLTVGEMGGAFSQMHSALQASSQAALSRASELYALGGGESAAYQEALLESRGYEAQAEELLGQITQARTGELGAQHSLALATHAIAKYKALTYWGTGGLDEISRVFRSEYEKLGGYQEGLRSILNDPSSRMDYATRMQMQASLKAVELQREQLIPEFATTTYGILMGERGVATAMSSAALTRAQAFGTDKEGVQAFQAAIDDLTRTVQLMASALGSNLPDSAKQQIRQQIPGAQANIMSTQIAARAFEIGRFEARATTSLTEMSPTLAIAHTLGGSADVWNTSMAYQQQLAELQRGYQQQLERGGLTVEQEFDLRKRVATTMTTRFGALQEAIDLTFKKQDIEGYMPERFMLGQKLERLQSMPYAPGNVMMTTLEMMQLNRRRVSQLDERRQWLEQTGNLSPEREYELLTSRESLVTENYKLAAMMANGAEERLVPLSAGVPASISRWTSWTLAALNLGLMGHPRRKYGAVSGAQAFEQDAFMSNVAGTTLGPLSPNALVDQPQAVSLLAEIAQTLKEIQMGGMRQPERVYRGSGGLAPTMGRIPDPATMPFNEQ